MARSTSSIPTTAPSTGTQSAGGRSRAGLSSSQLEAQVCRPRAAQGGGDQVGSAAVLRSYRRRIRALARTNQTVAAALGLHDNNGLDYVTALECLVLELAAGSALADRTVDNECIVCREIDCPGHGQ